jgi:hypothetical protein
VNLGAAPAARAASPEPRAIFGPFKIEKGLETLMHSSAEFKPAESLHIRKSELCATCHTLITKALGPNGGSSASCPSR